MGTVVGYALVSAPNLQKVIEKHHKRASIVFFLNKCIGDF
jgi:hypothetical protein